MIQQALKNYGKIQNVTGKLNDIQAYVNSDDAQGSKKEAEERNTFNER